jgi:hypothetical protein
MLKNLKYSLAGAAALCAIALSSGSALAMPNGLPSNGIPSSVENVRWVCGPFRCSWRPNYHAFYGARPFWGPRRVFWGPRWGVRRYARRW